MFRTKVKPQVNVRLEKDRYKSQAKRILDVLQAGGKITNIDLQRIAFNYTMRVSELRKEGHVILSEYEKPGVFSYTYLGNKNDD